MHPEIDRYAHLDSPLHRWDPRWKIASLALLLAAFTMVPPPAADFATWNRDLSHALACLSASLSLVELSRIPIGFILRRLLPVALFLGAFLLIYPLRATGEGIRLGSIVFSYSGLFVAGIIVLRAVAIILLAFSIFGSSRFDVTMKALRSLKIPGPFVQLAIFCYRYIYVYADELRRMRTAMKARGFRGRPPVHALRTAGNSLGMLLVRSVERTQGIYDAMVVRGYSGTFHTFQDFSTNRKDIWKATSTAALAGFILLLRFAP